MPKSRIVLVATILTVAVVATGVLTLLVLRFSTNDAESVSSIASVEDSFRSDTSSIRQSESNAFLVLPRDLASVDWESCEGRLVRIPGELVVVDTYNLAEQGQVTLAPERLYVPTNSIDPNSADPRDNSSSGVANVHQVRAAQQSNDRRCIILDDGIASGHHYPIKYFPGLGRKYETIRVGSKLSNLSGTVVKRDGKFFIQPIDEVQLEHASRPGRPTLGNANLTIASFNVQNYFTTIDDGSGEARGADSAKELERQKAKIVSTIVALEADVIGLIELENQSESELDLVASVNAVLGDDIFVGCGIPSSIGETPGGDGPIRVGLIYRKDRVEAIGLIDMIVDAAFSNARTPLKQKFRALSGSDTFTVVVNHFKSKSPRGANGDDVDIRDGQGAFNASRKRQSAALVRHLEMLNESHDNRVLVIGDLNAYGQEDPIDILRDAGLVDLASVQSESQHYSYVYYGQAGCLDHAFATPKLAGQVTRVAAWHINADEPRCLDYNEERNPSDLYRPTPYRSSDHDPIVIGMVTD